jgi:hypothetical protein
MIEYKIECAATLPELEKYVRIAIERGWRPQGGVAAYRSNAFYQAMIRTPSTDRMGMRERDTEKMSERTEFHLRRGHVGGLPE